MPYLDDGTPVDIVLNPLGVPSRMNVGQILETHLGWAARELGAPDRTPSSTTTARPTSTALRKMLKEVYAARTSASSSTTLARRGRASSSRASRERRHARGVAGVRRRDRGRRSSSCSQRAALADDGPDARSSTAAPASRSRSEVTVGVMYMLKLHHLVDDKIHARSIGPYSLVTQQPLGGKAQFGGQRLGEMEVWALEAYGAAYTLQEFLTVKSDDVAGRTRMYEAIVKGENVLEPGLPESFNVLVKELQSLALDVELLEDKACHDSDGVPRAESRAAREVAAS